MQIYVENIKLSFKEDVKAAFELAKKTARVKNKDVKDIFVVKRAVDARKRNNISFVYTVGIELFENAGFKLSNNVKMLENRSEEISIGSKKLDNPPIIVGFGPAGMFSAIELARLGYKPIVIERGGDVDSRLKAVDNFKKSGILNINSNIQFGEGGAGTFSDGKLTTRINDHRCRRVLELFYEFGAPKEILYEAKPHIGTDYLQKIVKNIRNEIIRLGGRVYFNTCLNDIKYEGRKNITIATDRGEMTTQTLILAIGHSARDTFRMLINKNVAMCVKPFSVGARIEHKQSMIDKSLYGDEAGNPLLPKGEYHLSHRDSTGRGVYSFCMCPGGVVVPAASVENTVVTNGMSYFSRDGENANAAIVVGVDSRDFGENPIEAIAFQEKIERNAYNLTGSYRAPAQTLSRFMGDGSISIEQSSVRPTYLPGVIDTDFRGIFPDFVGSYLELGIRAFGTKIKGFDDENALLTAPETRTSSPVRIMRNSESYESISIGGMYPCGEGAGYAGGIISAAVDGLRVAEQIIMKYRPIEV